MYHKQIISKGSQKFRCLATEQIWWVIVITTIEFHAFEPIKQNKCRIIEYLHDNVHHNVWQKTFYTSQKTNPTATLL